ncbi:MAG TPA: hypothetical protein VK612_05940, partial [Pyrinomonadaceae bacterium]|nr:hypothetical protein [Pyrinomonadaceae bacterium]
MSETILNKIFTAKRIRVEEAKRRVDPARLVDLALENRSVAESYRLRTALQGSGRINIIAEFKKASPSKGVI